MGEMLIADFTDRVQTSTLAPLGLNSTLLAPRGAPGSASFPLGESAGCWCWKFSQNSCCRSACSSSRDDTWGIGVKGQRSGHPAQTRSRTSVEVGLGQSGLTWCRSWVEGAELPCSRETS